MAWNWNHPIYSVNVADDGLNMNTTDMNEQFFIAMIVISNKSGNPGVITNIL